MATEGLHHPFADNFWGNEEASIQVIVERSRRSKQTSEQIKRLFEKRAQLEEDYGERLLQIAQSPIGDHEEFGSTFSETLSDIPAATEAAARAHLDLAQQIKHHLEIPLASFVHDQKEIRQATLDRADTAKKQKALQVSNATKAKDAYEMHCQQLMDMRRRLEDHSHQVGQEDIAKLQDQVAQTDQLYKQATQGLATTYNQWYEEWREVCDVFQSLEERRLHYLRSSLWAYANMMSSVHTIDDQSCERIRTSLECMEVGKDLDLFVQKRRTGQAPPEPLKYENHFEKLKTSTKRSDTTSGSVIKPLPPIAPPGSLWGNPTDDEGKAGEKAESKQIREITIPVVDEELRSVDVQLKRLPTMRNLSGDSIQPASYAAMSPLSTNGMLAVPEPETGNEISRRRSKELIESESAEEENADQKPPAIDTKNIKDDSLKPTQNGEHSQSDSSNDDAGSVSDFIISRSSNPRPTVIEGSSSIHGSSHKDDASSPRVQNDHEPTPVSEKRSSTGPTPPKSEKPVSSRGAVGRSPTQLSPVTILSDQKASLMASPVSMKKPVLPVPLNTHNINAPADTSQTNSARTHESPMTESNSPLHKLSLSQLQQDHFTPRSPQVSMSSPMPPITPDSMSPVRNHKESTKSPARTPGVNSSYNETNYMYPPTEEDVDLGIRPPPWGFDPMQANQAEQDSAGFQPALSSSYVDNASSPFLTRAAATMMTFPDKNHEGPRQNNKVEHNRSSPSIEPPSPNGTKSPSLAFKMKTAFAKSSMPEKARTADSAPKPSKSEADSRPAPRSATDPFVMPAHQVEKLKERSNSRFSLNIFKRDKESKRSRDKTRQQMVTNGEQESGHAPSMLSHTISDNESGPPPLPPAGHPPTASSPIVINRGGGERGPDSALGLGGGSSTPDLSWSPQKQKQGESIQIAQRMSSLGMEQLRQRQSGDTPSSPNWPTSSATLADGTPILEYVQALWSYKAQIPDAELSFETNDVLAVITKQQDGWWEAEILDQRRRQRGLVPSNFMKTLKTP